MIVINKRPHELPLLRPMKFADKRERAMLEYRRFVPLGGDGKIQSLTPEEGERLREYDAAKWLGAAPRWDGINFDFAPYGTQGCAYDLPLRVASFICEKYNRGAEVVCETEGDQILSMITRDQLPPGVTPIRPNLDDPLVHSSESYSVRTPAGAVVVSRGLADPPVPYDGKEIAVPVSAVIGSGQSAKGAKVSAPSDGEPVLNRP